MDALILSCSTGGGHNSAGLAVKEELERRGHRVTMLDPYSLARKNLDKKIGKCYVSIAQRTPRLFGLIYKMGNAYRKLPFHSPVYYFNKSMVKIMKNYLEENNYDVILMPHVFPGEILTYMKNKGLKIPKLIFISTDYTCIPFTEETNCDYYVIPSKELAEDYVRRGIPYEKLNFAGIPTNSAFKRKICKEEAMKTLGLDINKKYILLSGGSIGAGMIEKAVDAIAEYLRSKLDYNLIVVCGNNEKLLNKLKQKYTQNEQILLLSSTDKFVYYMKACELFISKPGGLSSTESAVANIPLIHFAPIPGCENLNMEFFSSRKMCVAVKNNVKELISAIEKFEDRDFVTDMLENQKRFINPDSASQICELAESIIE